jgi:hypothetical protein
MLEVFLVSVVYWTSLLFLFVWLNLRVQRLTARLATLEGNTVDREK